jgi:plasmid stabilization system protein ParE
MKVILLPKALENLNKIYRFISNVNERAAAETYNAILDKVELLKSFPAIAPLEPLLVGCKRQLRALLVKKIYKVIYYIEGETIYISNVWDCRQNPQRLITELKSL